ncbi:hypothetical protein ACFLRC_05095 [Candidatus Altiarchaeota archaeon]
MVSDKEILQDIKNDIKQTASEASRRVGKNPLLAEIYFTIFFSRKPLCIKEIAEATGYSIATISQTIDLVAQFTDVKRFKKPGSKKLYFECEHDPDKYMAPTTQMFKLVQQSMNQMTNTLSKAEEILKTKQGEEAQYHLINIQKLHKKYEEHNKIFLKFFEIMRSK